MRIEFMFGWKTCWLVRVGHIHAIQLFEVTTHRTEYLIGYRLLGYDIDTPVW